MKMTPTFSLLGMFTEGPLSWQGLSVGVELELLRGMAIPFNSRSGAHLQGERSVGRGAPAEKEKASGRAGEVAGGLERWWEGWRGGLVL